MPDKSMIPPSPTAKEYESARRARAGFEGDDPFALFTAWFEEAKAAEQAEPHAAALATCGADGIPDVRVVLVRSVDPRGFVFYSSTGSAKGRELAENPNAALNFHWKTLARQVRVRGSVSKVTAEEADVYFATRARGAQIGAWASAQSEPLDNRETLEAEVARLEAKFEGEDVPRPHGWTGYRVSPTYIEFWADGAYRLHDRFVFRRADKAAAWEKGRLYP